VGGESTEKVDLLKKVGRHSSMLLIKHPPSQPLIARGKAERRREGLGSI